MKPLLPLLGRYALTFCIVGIALFVGLKIWNQYQQTPWTRDGRVRIDVVRVSTDVGGLVAEVLVHDNETVTPGQVLVVLDRTRISATLERADAAIMEARVQLEQARKEAKRDIALGDLVAAESREQNILKVRTFEAALKRALADHNVASMDMNRTEIRATVHGIVTNLDIHPGDYLAAGVQAMALLDSASLRVEGYFEETKLHQIAIGDLVHVRLMGDDSLITGYVDSIAAGIAEDQRDNTGNLLPKISPTFSWVRLAQRIPVRIRLNHVPTGLKLIAGRTATVEIVPTSAKSARLSARN